MHPPGGSHGDNHDQENGQKQTSTTQSAKLLLFHLAIRLANVLSTFLRLVKDFDRHVGHAFHLDALVGHNSSQICPRQKKRPKNSVRWRNNSESIPIVQVVLTFLNGVELFHGLVNLVDAFPPFV